MEPWFARAVLRCPRCEYDVSQTLRDGFYICPECGSAVSDEICSRDLDYLSGYIRRLVYASWALPLGAIWVTMLLPSMAVLSLLFPPSAAAVYFGWWWVERWLEGPGAWRRAVGPALAVLVFDVLIAMGTSLLAAAAWR